MAGKTPNELLLEMKELYENVKREGQDTFSHYEDKIEQENFVESAKNLSAYLAVRRRDIRDLQENLMPWGLSSLGRLESKTLATLESVIYALEKIADEEVTVPQPSYAEYEKGRERLEVNTEFNFGHPEKDRYTRIMVTMPTEAAEDYDFVKGLADNGMDVARINCAHDNEEIWAAMIHNINRAGKEAGKDIKIMMDIAGPKIRTDWIFTKLKKPKLGEGDLICLTRNYEDLPDNSRAKVTAGFDVEAVFEAIQVGDPVFIDDGSIEARVIENQNGNMMIEVERAKGGAVRLKAEKGVNFPKTPFDIDVLSDKDKKDLRFVCQHADIIGCSFVRTAQDIRDIQAEVKEILGDKANDMALMAKIETVSGVENLPEIIFEAASKNPFSVMIARGDLAVESGYTRLAEIQQENMWICEAAAIPVVWGTEVMASMISEGIPTRAEVTDASEGSRAECVMLNKGEHMAEAVSMLDSIFRRMQEHQYKKTPRLRALNIANTDY